MKNGWIIEESGYKYHYLNDQLHHLTQPAVQTDVYKGWYQYGQLHRLEGPAEVWFPKNFSGFTKEWWYKGQKIDCRNQKEFKKLIKLLAFL